MRDRTLAAGWPDSPRRVRSILVEAARLAESSKAWLDAGFGSFGHFLRASSRCGPDAARSLFIDRCWWRGVRAEKEWADRMSGVSGQPWPDAFSCYKLSLETIWLHAVQRQVNRRSAFGRRLTAALTISWPFKINVPNLNADTAGIGAFGWQGPDARAASDQPDRHVRLGRAEPLRDPNDSIYLEAL
jgi:hypothetical protein